MSINTNISVVIVLYEPSESHIQQVIQTASVCSGIIVDNSSKPHFKSDNVGLMTYIPLYANHGIAEAQNIALRRLLSDSKTEYVVFLDQDSSLSLDYVNGIVDEYERIKETHQNLALLGPTVTNKETGEEYKSVIHRDIHDTDGFVLRREVISSGSCISLAILRKVGLLDETLFIDFVDFEWCWRAKNMGYVCGITPNMHLDHKVGQKQLSIGAYKVIISTPSRYFYQYRNHLWLSRRRYVPLQWKIATGVKHIMRLLYFPLVVDGGLECVRNMIRGIKASFRIVERKDDE